MKCHVCLGELKDELTTFTADVNGCVIIIRNVPSHVCSQCGEISYSDEVAARLEEMVDNMKNGTAEVTMATYAAA